MRGWRPLVLTLACALVAPTVAVAHPPAKHTPNNAAAARAKALTAFQTDLVNVLAPSGDATRLTAAALMARTLPNPPKLNTFHRLIERAAQADDAGPAVTWMRLADCNPRASGACPNADALAALTKQAPENAAVWLLRLSADVNNMKKRDARQDLANAAAAKLYDDYTGVALKALASTVSTLPPPSDTINPGSPAGASGVQMLIVYGTAASLPQPALRDTATYCEKHAPGDASVKDDCLKLGHLLEWGSSPLARSLGLHLRETLNPDPAQQQDARLARRNLAWQVQNFAELSLRAQSDKAQSQHLLALARNGGTQMSLMLAALRDDGIPTEAPVDRAGNQESEMGHR